MNVPEILILASERSGVAADWQVRAYFIMGAGLSLSRARRGKRVPTPGLSFISLFGVQRGLEHDRPTLVLTELQGIVHGIDGGPGRDRQTQIAEFLPLATLVLGQRHAG